MRAAAFEALLPAACPDRRLPVLRAGLRDEDVRVRREAADCLANLRLDVPGLADDLTRALNDHDPDVRFRGGALWLLKSQGSEAAIEALISLAGLPDVPPDPGRYAVVSLIQKTGDKAQRRAISRSSRSSRPRFVRGARGTQSVSRHSDRGHAFAVPPLRELHRSDDRVLRCLAALALSGMRAGVKTVSVPP